MAEITAGMVKELREATGLGMMECKKALVETNGDFKAAEELMRIKSGAKASKAASRVTAEGVIGSYLAADGKTGAVAEVNCETDFVAKNDDFMAFAKNVAQTVAQKDPADIEALLALPVANGSGSVEETRKALVMKLGENLSVRRFERYETSTGKLSTYLHGSKIGVMVNFSGGDEVLGKDLAMHIAASKPKSVDASGVNPEDIATERRIAIEKARGIRQAGSDAGKDRRRYRAEIPQGSNSAGPGIRQGRGRQTDHRAIAEEQECFGDCLPDVCGRRRHRKEGGRLRG